jgi:hypothetical protein
MADQVTDTKSGTNSGLFADCIIGLKFDNRTDPFGLSGPGQCAPWTDESVLLSNYKLVMLSVNRQDHVPDLVSVT